MTEWVTCSYCGGAKKVYDQNTGKQKDCPACYGTGKVAAPRKKK